MPQVLWWARRLAKPYTICSTIRRAKRLPQLRPPVYARSQVQAAKPAAAVPHFACVSVLKGRRRYRAAALVGNAELAKLIEEKVSTLPDVQFVQVSAVTGSILVFAHSEGDLG